MKLKIVLYSLALALPLSIVSASLRGAVDLQPSDWWQVFGAKLGFFEQADQLKSAVIWNIRLPRVLLSVLVGASLALSGTAMQGLFRNPLADPSIIGISAGAAFAASLVIVLLSSLSVTADLPLLSDSLLSLATFLGAVGSAVLIFMMAREGKRTDVRTMLLGGIALNACAGAFIGLLTFMADDAQLRSLTFWTMGSLGGADYQALFFMLPPTLATLWYFSRESKAFNALSLGETEAVSLGTDVEALKRKVILLTGLVVGVSVAFCGMIGFVGLVVPHILRLGFSADHRFLVPASALGGGLLLCWTDTLARTAVAPQEIPIGVITSLVGAPIFLYLIFQQKKKYRA